MFEIVTYTTANGNSPLEDFILDLTKKNKIQEIAQIKLFIERLAEYGLKLNEVFPRSYKKLDKKIFELRPGKNRVLFFYFTGNVFVLLHAFTKSSQKTPLNEIQKANKERKDFIGRQQQ